MCCCEPQQRSARGTQTRRRPIEMEYKTINLVDDDRIATITLNRPDKRNAISYELIEELLAALEDIANSSARVLILTGTGKAFCSGMDLEDLKALVGRS